MIKKKKKTFGPVIVIVGITIAVMILSCILNLLGVKGYITEAGTLETSLVTINNVLSKEGIRYIFNNSVANFRLLEPLSLIVMSLVAVSIAEASGLLKALFSPLKKIKPKYVTFIVIFVGIISTILGDYSYSFLLPIAGILYKYINRNPSLGVITMFIAITIGYGTGLIYNYQDYLLGIVTQNAAIGIDKTYQFNLLSEMYIMIVSTFILSVLGTIIIEKTIAKKYHRKDEKDNLNISKKAMKITFVVFILLLFILIYSVIPGLPLSGVLLDNSQNTYIAKLFGDSSSFNNGLMLILVGILMVCGFIYGTISRNIKSSNDYSKALTKTFENTGYIFVLMFFASIMIGIIDWTNIGTVIAVNLVDFISKLEFTGSILIAIVFISIVVMSVLIPSTITKWNLIAPVLVPVMIRANISPDFTQFLFKAADSVGKCFSPIYIYFIIMIGFLYKYNKEENISIFKTMKKIMPIVLLMFAIWLVIVIGWNLIGAPMGINSTVSM